MENARNEGQARQTAGGGRRGEERGIKRRGKGAGERKGAEDSGVSSHSLTIREMGPCRAADYLLSGRVLRFRSGDDVIGPRKQS